VLQSIHPPHAILVSIGRAAWGVGTRPKASYNHWNNSPWPLFPSSNRLVGTENRRPKTNINLRTMLMRSDPWSALYVLQLAWLLEMDDCLSNQLHACSFRSEPTSGSMMSVLAFP
jgi:hypothetical protein